MGHFLILLCGIVERCGTYEAYKRDDEAKHWKA
jgi:hypothetical protein